ncbi:WD repeat-containing protein 18, partial [Sarcoptes scabiei]
RIEHSLFCGSSKGPIYHVRLKSIQSETIKNEYSDNSNYQIQKIKSKDFLDLSLTQSTNELQSFTGHTASVNVLSLTIDGQGLLSGSTDKTLRIWHIFSHSLMRTISFKG